MLRTATGNIEMLQFVLKNNPAAKTYADIIEEQIIVWSAYAAEEAFVVGDFSLMHQFLGAVPYYRRSRKLHLKALIGHSPNVLSQLLRRTAMALGAAVRPQAPR